MPQLHMDEPPNIGSTSRYETSFTFHAKINMYEGIRNSGLPPKQARRGGDKKCVGHRLRENTSEARPVTYTRHGIASSGAARSRHFGVHLVTQDFLPQGPIFSDVVAVGPMLGEFRADGVSAAPMPPAPWATTRGSANGRWLRLDSLWPVPVPNDPAVHGPPDREPLHQRERLGAFHCLRTHHPRPAVFRRDGPDVPQLRHVRRPDWGRARSQRLSLADTSAGSDTHRPMYNLRIFNGRGHPAEKGSRHLNRLLLHDMPACDGWKCANAELCFLLEAPAVPQLHLYACCALDAHMRGARVQMIDGGRS